MAVLDNSWHCSDYHKKLSTSETEKTGAGEQKQHIGILINPVKFKYFASLCLAYFIFCHTSEPSSCCIRCWVTAVDHTREGKK